MGAQVKSEAREPATMTAAEYRRKIIRMVALMGNTKWLKMINDFVYTFYVDDFPNEEAMEDDAAFACRMITLIENNPKRLKTIRDLAQSAFIKEIEKGGVQA